MVGRVAILLPQAEAALRTGLFRVTAFCEGKAVEMGRLVGDGSMYWYIQDMAVLPEYQGRGIEKAARSSPEPSPDTGRRLQSGDRPCIVIGRQENEKQEKKAIMWTANNWKDYEVIDTGSGEKLERWGKYLLVRPDPQVIWESERKHPGWTKPNGHYHRSSRGGGEWEFFDLPQEWSIHYRNLTFRLKPFSFKHTGLFPEQAVNWDWFSDIIANAGRPLKVLNLFAYTGGATLSAAAAGASVTHVDASRGMVTWAKENAAASGLGDAPIRWLVDDCVKFVEREIRRGNTYDGIIMDPPSYGRGPKGEIWKIEESIFPFVRLCTRLLSRDARFFLINSYTTGLQPAVLSYMMNLCITPSFGGHVEAGEIGLPVTENGLILPCGASGRWTR